MNKQIFIILANFTFTNNLKRNVNDDDIIRLTEIKIKRISKFDINKAIERLKSGKARYRLVLEN